MGAYVDGDISALTTSVTTLTGVTWPTHGGDDLAIVAHGYGDGTNTGTMDANFANIADLTDTNLRALVGKRIPTSMTGSESGDVTLTTTTGARQVGALVVYSGYSDVQQIVNQPETSGTAQTTHASPAITPQKTGSGFVAIYMDRVSAGNTTVTPPAGFTLRKEFGTVGTGGIFMHVADDLSGTHGLGAFTPGSWTVAVGSTSAVVFLIELAPTLLADAALSGTASLVATAAKLIAGAVSLTGTAALTAAASRIPTGTASLTGTATLSAAADVVTGLTPVVVVSEAPLPRRLRVDVFDENLNKQGRIGEYMQADVVLKHNQIGSWSLLLDIQKDNTLLLPVPGRRVVLSFEPRVQGEPAEFLMSGPVASWEENDTVGELQTLSVAGYDDKVWLDRRLAFPDPDAVFPAEGVAFTQAAAYQDLRTGNGESVAKAFIQANAIDRLAIPNLTIAPNLGRGSTVTFAARMHQLLWMTFISCTYSGLGFDVKQIAGDLVFDVYVPQEQPVRLSKRLGNLSSFKYRELAPKVTHGVAGGTGEGTARKFMRKSLAGSAVGWGVTEAFVDATDADTDAVLLDRLNSFLAEGAPVAGFSLVPRDTQAMQFGRDYRLGDKVRVEGANGLILADTVRQVTISHTVQAGMVITPGIGYSESTEPTAAIYRTYRRFREEFDNFKRSI